MVPEVGWLLARAFGPAPAEIEEATARFDREVDAALEAFRSASEKAIHVKLRGRLTGRVSDLKRRLDQIGEIRREAGKAAALERHPFLANVGAVVRPRGKPQERILSSLTPFLLAGESTLDVAYEAAERHIDELMDGNPCHIVYSV